MLDPKRGGIYVSMYLKPMLYARLQAGPPRHRKLEDIVGSSPWKRLQAFFCGVGMCPQVTLQDMDL